MSRCLPYRVECTKKCLQAQNDALHSIFFILRQTGPTAFVIKGDNEQIYKVSLGNPHQCTCCTFQRDHEPCKHICWLLLKRFRVPRANPNENDADSDVEQRLINENDVCPICQEELLVQKLPVTYCRRGCGNNIHVKCMKIWLDHQVSIGERAIKCPLCREIFGTPEQLKLEFETMDGQKPEQPPIHFGRSCHRCRACPITGKCYKCTACQDYYLCQICFNLNIHTEHSFDYREKPFQDWKIATREHLTALSNTLRHILANREINQNDHEVLIQLENAQNTTIMSMPENVVKSMPTERIHENSRLLQNHEHCRLCLRSYQIGERVRRLPCRHKFHIDCIDGWLLHSHSTCPIDGQLLWNVGMKKEQREIKRPLSAATRKVSKNVFPVTDSSLTSSAMGLTVTPYRIQDLTNIDSNQRSRLSYVQNSLRPVTATVPVEFSPLLELNGRSLQKTRSNHPLSSNIEQRQFRQQSLLSSPSLVMTELRRVNAQSNQYSKFSVNMLNRSLQRRSCSSAK